MNHFTRYFRFAHIVALVIWLSACGGGGGSDSSNQSRENIPPSPQSIAIGLEHTDLLFYGDKRPITLTLTYTDGTQKEVGSSAQWSVDPGTIARIEEEDGTKYLAPLDVGSGRVTASYENLTDTIEITVSPYIHSLEAKQNAIVFPVNTAMPLLDWAWARVQGAPDFSIRDDIIYRSSNPEIAGFSGDPYSIVVHPDRSPLVGHVTPRATGSATVTMHYDDVIFGETDIDIRNFYLLNSDESKGYIGPGLMMGVASNESGDLAVLTGAGCCQFSLDLQVFDHETGQLGAKFNVFEGFDLKASSSSLQTTFSGDVLTIFWISPTGAFSADINTTTREVSYHTLDESPEDAFVGPNLLFKSNSGSLLACWLNTKLRATHCKSRSSQGIWISEILELPNNIRNLEANSQGEAVLTRVSETPEGEKYLQAYLFSFDEQPITLALEEVLVSVDAGGTRQPAINQNGDIVVPVVYRARRDELDIRGSGLQMASRDVAGNWSVQEIYAYKELHGASEVELAWSGSRALLLLTDYLVSGTATWLLDNGDWSQLPPLGTIGMATPTLDYPVIPVNGSWVLPVRAPRNLYLFCFNNSLEWTTLETFEALGQWGEVSGTFTTTPSLKLPLLWMETAAFGTEDGGFSSNSLYFFNPQHADLGLCANPAMP